MTPASPLSGVATSDMEAPSSPVTRAGKSSPPPYDLEDVTMVDGTPDPPEKPTRGKDKRSQKQDANGAQQLGKIRHLKKDDGEPLWRKDIQHDFLKAVFDNEAKVFTNSYDPDMPKQNFADLYIDTMSRSTKTSKVLRDKLLSDRDAAKGMAMVCLLVNMGRMNTTLNFFPEMRAQLRTYHAIPSLQAHQDPHAYKQLQDAPRLKSILKGGADDREEPGSLEKIKERDIPRTNPVNLIFVMCNTAQKIAELHFPPNHEFVDLIMKTHYSSKSRATAFLWLMWFYLESDFTEEGCEENPFGPGVDYGLDVANQGVPELEALSEEKEARENVDTEEEIEFGLNKQKVRAKILEMDQVYLHERENKRGKARMSVADDGPAILPRIRPSKRESDVDSSRSTPPPRSGARGEGAGSKRRSAALKYQIFEGSSPAPQPNEGVVARKPRPPTAHQLAVERNRNQRVEYILDRGIRKAHRKSRKLRRQDGGIFRAYQRVQAQVDPFEDSEADDMAPRNLAFGGEKAPGPFRERGLGGLCLLNTEEDDFGEEVSTYAAALRRAARRLSRWYGHEKELGVVAPVKKRKKAGEAAGDGEKALDGDAGASLGGKAAKAKLLEEVNGDTTVEDVDMEEMDPVVLADEEDDPDRTEVMGESDAD